MLCLVTIRGEVYFQSNKEVCMSDGFEVWKRVNKALGKKPLLSRRGFESNPLRAWENLFQVKKGVVPKIREKKRKMGGISGLF